LCEPPERYRDKNTFREAVTEDEIKGKAEEVKGKLTDDMGEGMKGKAHQAVDKVKRAGHDVPDDVHDEADKQPEDDEREKEAEPVQEPRPW
jgi:uncharacterized protein YjbJ (UPF0337 family)